VLLGSLAVGEIFRLIFLNWVPVTRGPMGIFGIPDPMLSLGDIELGLAGKYWMALVLLAFGVWVVRRMQGSLIGTAWRSIREDTVAARSSGVPMSRYLNIAFGVSGFLAGIAGSQYAYLVTVIHPDSFMVIFSITLLTMAVIGGLGNPTGAIIGGVVLSALPEVLRGFDDYRMVAYGLLLVLIVRFRPRGLVGTM
jgi:branched-chain amino acid transport system permease protein